MKHRYQLLLISNKKKKKKKKNISAHKGIEAGRIFIYLLAGCTLNVGLK